jgi:hypothetical protein
MNRWGSHGPQLKITRESPIPNGFGRCTARQVLLSAGVSPHWTFDFSYA